MIAVVATLVVAVQTPECADSALAATAVPSAKLDEALRPLRRPPVPEYPSQLASNARPGKVVFEVLVLPSGELDRCSIRVVTATHRAFIEPARRSVNALAFAPPLAGGKPVPARTQVEIQFRVTLQPAPPPQPDSGQPQLNHLRRPSDGGGVLPLRPTARVSSRQRRYRDRQ